MADITYTLYEKRLMVIDPALGGKKTNPIKAKGNGGRISDIEPR